MSEIHHLSENNNLLAEELLQIKIYKGRYFFVIF